MSENHLNPFLKSYSKREIERIVKQSTMKIPEAIKVFSYSDYNFKRFRELIKKKSNSTKTVIQKKIKDYMVEHNIDVTKLLSLRKKQQEMLKTNAEIKDDVKKTVRKLKNVVDVFDVNTSSVMRKIDEAMKNDDFNSEDLLPMYIQIFKSLMRQANGELSTIETTITYEVKEDENGNIKKIGIKPSRDGKKYITETKKSSLPNGRVFAEAMVVLEIIQHSGNDDNFMTDAEVTEAWEKYYIETKTIEDKTKKDKARYENEQEEEFSETIDETSDFVEVEI